MYAGSQVGGAVFDVSIKQDNEGMSIGLSALLLGNFVLATTLSIIDFSALMSHLLFSSLRFTSSINIGNVERLIASPNLAGESTLE